MQFELVVLLSAAAIGSVSALICVLLLGRRFDQIGDCLMELRQLERNHQPTERSLGHSPLGDGTDTLSSELSELKRNINHMRRQQVALVDALTKISSSLEAYPQLPSRLEEVRREQSEAAEAVAAISCKLDALHAAFDSPNSELGRLLESEAVVEFRNSIKRA